MNWCFPGYPVTAREFSGFINILGQSASMDQPQIRSERAPESRFFAGIKRIALIVVGCFFLLFGIHLLISAYRLNNPFWFIMTFFASNLIILISAALLIGFILKLRNSFRSSGSGKE